MPPLLRAFACLFEGFGFAFAFWFLFVDSEEKKERGLGGFIYRGSGSDGEESMWGGCDLDDGMDGCDVGFYVCVIFQRMEK